MKKLTLFNRPSLLELKVQNDDLHEEHKRAAEFVRQIIEGNLNAHYDPAVPGELSSALQVLRDKTARLYDEEKQRNWVNEGLARFAELLRIHQQDTLKEVFHKVICELVIYLNANQGGLFVLRETETN